MADECVLSNSRPGLIHTHNLIPAVLHMCASRHALSHTCANISLHTDVQTCLLSHTYLRKQVYSTLSHMRVQTCILSHVCANIYSHTRVQTCILSRVCASMYTLSHVCKNSCTLSVPDTSVQMYIITHTHTCVHACILSLTHTHTHTS